ncbi:hypothetical protein GR160_02790 [Flavobacterium sp. Sd200]|uniref:hypothetical protein n=1 Tax=Flavobacterium sp. Sd200 TaxID=2692211 RepID=UPI00136CDCC2|nr:hypothetical protein [Flavobacterium sp. Sd200]MXN90140.1 hypothetical protein [Flavobacterium sp. Sd200]
MDKKKKIILGVAVLGAAAFIFKDKLFPSSSTTAGKSGGSNSPYEGMIIQEEGSQGWGKVFNGEYIPYWTDTAWQADTGGILPTVISAAEFAKIPKASEKGIDLNATGVAVIKDHYGNTFSLR